jgi:hypothetical protein
MSGQDQPRGSVPLYARLLRLRRLRIGALASFILVECTITAAILLALAELVSWWAVVVLPTAVAAMVKVNDLVGAPVHAAGRSGRHGTANSREEFPVNRSRAGAPRDAPRYAGGLDRFGEPVGGLAQQAAGLNDATRQWHAAADGESLGRRWDQATQPVGAGYWEPRTARHDDTVTPPAAAQRWQGASAQDLGREGRPQGTTQGAVWQPQGTAQGAAGQRHGTGQVAAEPQGTGQHNGVPTGPARAYVIGAAVRRSMAAQLQRGANAATGSAGRHSRSDPAANQGRRAGFNERPFGRIA